MSEQPRKQLKGRGSSLEPENPYLHMEAVPEWDYLETDTEALDEWGKSSTEFLQDDSRSIISENQSPDIPFRYSLNPYRGCEHGCSYCYARPTHEYYGLNAGIDFESKIFVKENAPKLFRDWLARKGYMPEVVMFSGVTDCYQPVERRLQLTRQCLEVALEARQPVAMITKNALVVRDLDLLSEMAEKKLVVVAVSVTTLQTGLGRSLEPRTSSPEARLRAIQELSAKGIPTRVMVAPIIPGLNDQEIPEILKAARVAGATTASYVLLRLSGTVKPVFLNWLEEHRPTEREKILSRIQSTRAGQLNDSRFGSRMKGEGFLADQIKQLFSIWSRKLGFDTGLVPLETSQFRPPTPSTGQQFLF